MHNYRSLFLTVTVTIFLSAFFSNILLPISVSFDWKSEYEGSLKIILDRGEAVCDSSIKLSIDDPERSLRAWEVCSDFDPEDEYVSPLKSNKQLYRKPFIVRLFFDKPIMWDVSCHWSCFVVEDDVQVVPFFKKVLIRPRVTLKRKVKKFTVSIKDTSVPLIRKTYDKPSRALNTNVLMLLVLSLLFVGFVFVQILKFSDIAGFLALGGFVLFGRILLPYIVLLIVGAIGLFSLSIFMFRKSETDRLEESASTFLQSMRSLLGFLCGASVLPLLVEAYLVFRFC